MSKELNLNQMKNFMSEDDGVQSINSPLSINSNLEEAEQYFQQIDNKIADFNAMIKSEKVKKWENVRQDLDQMKGNDEVLEESLVVDGQAEKLD